MDPPLRERIRLRDSTWGGEAPGVRARTARTGALFCLLGALFGLISAVTPDAAVHDKDLLVIVSVLAAALALALRGHRRPHARGRLPPGRPARHGAGERGRCTPGAPATRTRRCPFLWVTIFVFYFFRLRPALVHMALIAAGYAIVLVARGHRPHAGGRMACRGGNAGDRRVRGVAAPRPPRRHDRASRRSSPTAIRSPSCSTAAASRTRSTSSWSGPGAATRRSALWWPISTASRA